MQDDISPSSTYFAAASDIISIFNTVVDSHERMRDIAEYIAKYRREYTSFKLYFAKVGV